jgi:cytidine deaminase
VTAPVELDDEDRKLLVLARGASLRAHVPHSGVAAGAAVRDADGRTYAGAAVENADPALCTSALRAAVAAAASSGARRFEAAVVVTAGDFDEEDLGLLSEFGSGVPVFVAGSDGAVHTTLAS